MKPLNKQEKISLRDMLKSFREDLSNWTTADRLCVYPFPYEAAKRLFGVSGLSISPCAVFGRQLVLKIIDELLDIGGMRCAS